MKAVLMAGGFGTRIQPLTFNLPKPMIPLFNRPIMLHIVDLLKQHGIDELIILLYYQPLTIKNFFGDGSEFGIKITYVTPLEDYGTAGAVKMAQKYLDDRFLIISGDLLTDFNLTELLEFHERKGAQATLTLTSVDDPLQFGVVITDQDSRITKFLEKPGWSEVFSDTINTGIYVLEPEVLDLMPEGENRDWSKDIFPQMLAQSMSLYGCNMPGYWADIGNTDAYIETCNDVFNKRVQINLQGNRVPNQEAEIYLGKDAHLALHSDSRLEGMIVLGDNSKIPERVRLKNCVIGRNCIIEDGVELQDAILWDNVYVRRKSRIHSAVLGHNVRLGQSVQIEEGAVIADDTTVGDDAHIKKDVKVWPRKEIEAGATVTGNLIWGEKWRKSLFEGPLVRGLTNVELTPEFTARLGAAYGSTLGKDACILAGRDAVRSSRMLKRAFVGGLLSTGVNVRDAKMVPLPVLRYKLTTFGEAGGVHFRQSPDDPAVTEVLFFTAEGMELGASSTKGIERIYYKENFRRAHYAEPGEISEIPQIYHFYREGFCRHLDTQTLRQTQPRVVVDLNHSPASNILPQLLGELGCEVVELNSQSSDYGAKSRDTQYALDQLGRIVQALGAQAGFWLGPSGESLYLVDNMGTALSHLDSMGVLTALVCRSGAQGQIILPVAAPQSLQQLCHEYGMPLTRTRGDGRTLLEMAQKSATLLTATTDGRFAFPGFHCHFDALYAIPKILELSARCGQSLADIRLSLPRRSYLQNTLPCPWQCKGGIMRKMSEVSVELEADFTDGIKVSINGDWLLLLPDQYRPLVHLIADSASENRARQLLEQYTDKVRHWLQELQEQDQTVE